MPDDQINDAIQNYLHEAGEEGSMLTKYFVVAEYIDSEGKGCWLIKSPQGQTMADGYALLKWAELDVEEQIRTYMRLAREDDE